MPNHRRARDSQSRPSHWRPSPCSFAAAAVASGDLRPLLALEEDEPTTQPVAPKRTDDPVSKRPPQIDESSRE